MHNQSMTTRHNHWLTTIFLLWSGAALTGCGGSGSPDSVVIPTPVQTVPQNPPPATQPPVNLAVPDNRTVTEFRVVLLGNSHVANQNIAGLLKELLQTGRPQAKVFTQTAGGRGYLDERLNDNVTLPLLTEQNWTHVILQGQKYSTSGLYSYPIDAALYWVALIKSRQGTPILFPEHATLGNNTEGARVYQLHQSIVQQQAACLTPVPQAWASILAQWPDIHLHLNDGNHASLSGAVLTSMLFYQVITGNPADQLPYIADLGLSASVQQRLAQQASASLQQHPACPF
jgi:hypothetical protein